MPTPWGQYQTREPEIFFCGIHNGFLLMEAGSHMERSPSAALNIASRQITMLPSGASKPVPVLPYRLSLPKWREGGNPIIRLHPFALFHLLVTGQLPVKTLTGSLKTFLGGLNIGIRVPVGETCSLLSMLDVRHADLSFATNFDFSVARR